MKKLASLLLILICCSSVLANDPEPKTFLVLFESSELKQLKTNVKSIESQFADVFSTKYYSGNSELALVIEMPSQDFDKCFLGSLLVNLENGGQIPLQQIAFRIYDLTENKVLHERYEAMYEESLVAKKKAAKVSKADSEQRGASGH